MISTFNSKAWEPVRVIARFTYSHSSSSRTKLSSLTSIACRNKILPGTCSVRTLSDKARDVPNSLSHSSMHMSTQLEYDPHRYHQPKTEKVIRATNLYHNRSKWGFVICRCTYKSEAKWEKFMSRIKDDAKQYLRDDPALFKSMDWTVLTDPKLNDAHYVVAARCFGEWVEKSLIEESKAAATLERIKDGPCGWQPGSDPRHRVFIYANEDAVNSVVEHAEGEDKDGAEDYFLYLVNYDAVQEREKDNQEIIDMTARRDLGEALPSDEKITDSLDDVAHLDRQDLDLSYDGQEWRELRIKFRASDLVPGYATVEDAFGWEYGFDCGDLDIYVPEGFDTSAVRSSLYEPAR